MVDRTQLTEARLYLFREVPDPDGSLEDALADLIDNGALVPVNFPTDEMVEVAAQAWMEPKVDDLARHSLEAVRRVMIGDADG